jgi:hypothetical protein
VIHHPGPYQEGLGWANAIGTFGFVFIVAGVGLYFLKRWARILTLVCAFQCVLWAALLGIATVAGAESFSTFAIGVGFIFALVSWSWKSPSEFLSPVCDQSLQPVRSRCTICVYHAANRQRSGNLKGVCYE